MSTAPDIIVKERADGGWTHAVAVPGTSRRDYVGHWPTRRKAAQAIAAHKKALRRRAVATS